MNEAEQIEGMIECLLTDTNPPLRDQVLLLLLMIGDRMNEDSLRRAFKAIYESDPLRGGKEIEQASALLAQARRADRAADMHHLAAMGMELLAKSLHEAAQGDAK